MILAAGASERMGSPKALLRLADNRPLARFQVEVLLRAGCSDVVTVLGADAQAIRDELPEVDIVVNKRWEMGRFSSVQTGLQALCSTDGCVILPVDTVGVSPETIAAMLDYAQRELPLAIRPIYDNKEGHIAWISSDLAAELIERDPGSSDVRLDDILRPIAIHLPVDDPAILTNVNTAPEWYRARSGLTLKHEPSLPESFGQDARRPTCGMARWSECRR